MAQATDLRGARALASAMALAAAVALLALTAPALASGKEDDEVPNSCRQKETVLECVGGGLTELPKKLPSKTKQLVFCHNKLPSLKEGVLSGEVYEQIKKVLLEHNGIKDVDKFSFSGMYRVTDVSLAHNQVADLPPDLLCPSSLRNLSLANNPLRPPRKGALMESESLQELSLEGTTLTHLHDDTFSKLPQLQRLNLANSSLHQLNPKALQPLAQLQYLDLGRNNISNLPDDAFQHNPELRQLNASGTRLGAADWVELARPLTKLAVLDLRACDPPSRCDCAWAQLAARCALLADLPCPDPDDCSDASLV